MKKKLINKKVIYYSLLVLVLAVFGYSLSKVVYEKYVLKEEEKAIEEVTLLYETVMDEDENKILEYQNLYNNKDIVGTIKIENTSIDEVIVQGNDNSYYLNHLPNKKINSQGSLMVDYRVDLENGNRVIIYGHNSRTRNTTFKNLEKYLDEDFFKENKKIELETLYGNYTYEIFSVMITSDDTIYRKLDFKNDDELIKNYETIRDLSIYDSNISFAASDELLVLQTCIYNQSKGNLLVVSAKKVK